MFSFIEDIRRHPKNIQKQKNSHQRRIGPRETFEITAGSPSTLILFFHTVF